MPSSHFNCSSVMHDHELTSQRSSGPIRVGEAEAEFPPNQRKEYRVQAAPLVFDTFSHIGFVARCIANWRPALDSPVRIPTSLGLSAVQSMCVLRDVTPAVPVGLGHLIATYFSASAFLCTFPCPHSMYPPC
jgi:hypothetical protein